MKVKFLKDHLNNKAGDVIEVDEARATYWEKTGVAESTEAATTEKKVKTPVKEKKEAKPKKEKKSKAGPGSK